MGKNSYLPHIVHTGLEIHQISLEIVTEGSSAGVKVTWA
jgi:hypothetical protein